MDIGFWELIVVGIIAFLVLGPEDFIRYSTKAGQWLGKMKTEANNFRIMAQEQVLIAAEQKRKRESGENYAEDAHGLEPDYEIEEEENSDSSHTSSNENSSFPDLENLNQNSQHLEIKIDPEQLTPKKKEEEDK